MRNRKILNVLVVLLSIFVVVSFTLSQVVATDYFKNMFWVGKKPYDGRWNGEKTKLSWDNILSLL